MSKDFNPYDLSEPAEPAPHTIAKKAPIESGVLCVACGYELTSLSRDGVCPECGSPTTRSLGGNQLRHASADYLNKLRVGSICVVSVFTIQVFIGLLIVTGVLFTLRATMPALVGDAISLVVGLALSAVSLYGWWMMTSPDPGSPAVEQASGARTVVRGSVIAQAATLTISTVIGMLIPEDADPTASGAEGVGAQILTLVTYLSLAAGVVGYFAGLVYIRYIASRVPDESMMERARHLMWAPLILIGALVLIAVPILNIFVFLGEIVGWIAWFIAYVLFVDKVRAEAIRARDLQLRGEPLSTVL